MKCTAPKKQMKAQEEKITYGASVYMWHEGLHSSDVYWFRAKLEWGKEGQEHGYLGQFNKNICS